MLFCKIDVTINSLLLKLKSIYLYPTTKLVLITHLQKSEIVINIQKFHSKINGFLCFLHSVGTLGRTI